MQSTLSDHVRTNVVGYLALFLVLTGGTAYALDGTDTVFTDDIVNGEVRTADLRTAAVTSGKIRDGEVLNADLAANVVTGANVGDGSLGGADLADRSIGGQKIGVETLAGVNVNDGSLLGADIGDDSLGASDIGGDAVGASELNPSGFEPSDIAQKSASDPRFGINTNAVQGSEVSDNTLTDADISESTLDTPEAAFSKTDARIDLPADSSERTVARRTVEPGNYVVLAKASLSSDAGQFVTCRINAVRPGGAIDLDETTNPTVKPQFGLPGAWENVSMLGLVSSTGQIDLAFICAGDGVTLDHVRLVAVKVNRFIGTDAP